MVNIVEANGARIPGIGLGTMISRPSPLRLSTALRPDIAISILPSAMAMKRRWGGAPAGLRSAGLKRDTSSPPGVSDKLAVPIFAFFDDSLRNLKLPSSIC